MRTMLVFVLAFSACDSRAKASDPVETTRSKEYESCGTSSHCADPLRCFDHVCRRVGAQRSTVGDYFAALGAAKRSIGDFEAAVDAYTRALGHYETEKLAPPAEVDCGYGSALAANKRKKEHAELAARVLHRCLNAVAGGPMRDRALADLATLADVGLDPLALGSPKLADVYLTRGPGKPSTDKVAVTVAATPPPKPFASINDKLGEADLKAALISCWEAYNGASKKDVLVVAIGVKVAFFQNPDYEDEGGYATKLDPPVAMAAGSPDAAADACVRAIVEPALKDLKLHDAFTTRLAITIKPV